MQNFRFLTNIKLIIIAPILILVVIAGFLYACDFCVYDYLYDFHSDQKEVETKKQLENVLNSFDRVAFHDLPESYIKYSGANDPKFYSNLQARRYYKIEGYDKYKYIAGKIRIKSLLAHDKFYKVGSFRYFQPEAQYLLVDKRLLFKLLALQQLIERLGYNKHGFYVRNAYRHPTENKRTHGAPYSRHIFGEAVDLMIQDIDGDGEFIEEKDKKIVYDLLDKKIIGNTGGIGRYPDSASLHFDVRGNRARWNNYKRKRTR